MTQINPKIKSHFDSLSPELQQEILRRNLKLNTLNDLISCLEKITAEV